MVTMPRTPGLDLNVTISGELRMALESCAQKLQWEPAGLVREVLYLYLTDLGYYIERNK